MKYIYLFFLGRNKYSVVLPLLLFLCLPSFSAPESQEVLQTGGVGGFRSVLSNTEVYPGFVYFVSVPRITQK